MVGLQTGPRGPAPGTGRFLTTAQEATIRGLICRGTPDAYGLPFALWGRSAVAALIEQRCGVRLAAHDGDLPGTLGFHAAEAVAAGL